MKRIALIIYCVTEFGGAERRLIRIFNQIGKNMSCDLIFRGCTEREAKMRLKTADCDTQYINKILCFDNSQNCCKYFYLYGQKYTIIHFIDVCNFNLAISMIGKIKKFNTLYTIAFVSDAYDILHNSVSIKTKILLKLVSVVDLLYPWAYNQLLKIRNGHNVFITPGTYTDLDIFSPKEKENILVYAAARLEKLKNPELLVNACLLCQEELRRKKYKIILLGKGELEKIIRNKITENKIEDILLMQGYKKTSDYFPKAKGVFSLQIKENYPSQVIAEAVASGCYLIISDVGYSRKTADKTFARFVKDNPEDLADAIREYINMTAKEQQTISQNARKYALVNYNIKESVNYFQNILINTANRNL